jgi:hypothetical protein
MIISPYLSSAKDRVYLSFVLYHAFEIGGNVMDSVFAVDMEPVTDDFKKTLRVNFDGLTINEDYYYYIVDTDENIITHSRIPLEDLK